MGVYTQASQIRLAQRDAQAGNWAVPSVVLEGWDSSWVDNGSNVWQDVTSNFDIRVNRLVSVGGQVDYSFIANRRLTSTHNVFRIRFENQEHSITTPQVVGNLCIVSQTTVGDDVTRAWAIYPLVAITEGRLETIQPGSMNWPTPAIGDVVQFYGTWFI